MRQVCLCKRRNGVFKKAADLAKLTGVDIAVVVIDGGKASEYGSSAVGGILDKYKTIREGGSAGEDNSPWAQLEAQSRQLEALSRQLSAEKANSKSLEQQLCIATQKPCAMAPNDTMGVVPEAMSLSLSLVPEAVSSGLTLGQNDESEAQTEREFMPEDPIDVSEGTLEDSSELDGTSHDEGESGDIQTSHDTTAGTTETLPTAAAASAPATAAIPRRHTPPPLSIECQGSSTSLGMGLPITRLDSTKSFGQMERLERQDSRLSFSSLYSNGAGPAESAAKRLKSVEDVSHWPMMPSPMSAVDSLSLLTPRSLFAAAAAEVALISP